ncbi:MAG: ATP-dependent helicase [Puniceicoccales bacterium]|jgi:DNA helicase-2/ATP-dependent DNA helicase PcrA|nr:ATP-dependent helicase [Puniceicoccales bacterium]
MATNFQKELNEHQYLAVSSPTKSTLVLAGAGTGKTRTLTYRVAWLLEHGVAPENILLLTFTNKAAKEMLSRVETITGFTSDNFYGGTFHHIAQKFLRRHSDRLGISQNFCILDDNDSLSLFSECVKEIDNEFLKNKSNPSPRVMLEILSYSINTRTSIANVLEQKYSYFDYISDYITKFSSAYQKKKFEQNVLDYDDLLLHFLHLLKENNDLLDFYGQRFCSILVDEYQDTNEIQMQIVDTLATDHQIFAVGDDAQCIYTWRGANIKNITEFADRHPGTNILKIEKNYRSTPQILLLANEIHVSERLGYGKTLSSARAKGRLPFLVKTTDPRQQANFIIKRLTNLKQDGYKLSDVAILYRAHYHSMELQMELTRYGIPYNITSGIRFFEQIHIKDIIAMLRFANNHMDSRAFVKILCRLPKFGEKTAEKLFHILHSHADLKNKHPVNCLEDEPVIAKVPTISLEYWRPLARTLKKIHTGIEYMNGSKYIHQPDDLFEYAAQRDTEQIATNSVGDLITLALYEEYIFYLQKNFNNSNSRQDDVESFANFASKFNDTTTLLNQVALMQSETTATDMTATEDQLRLTTVHQAKGLEFPVVFIIGLTENNFPLKRAIDEGNISEERRLFYVAVTRAKDELYMCYPYQSQQVNRNATIALPLQKSRFIAEIPKNFYEVISFGIKQPTNFRRQY